MKNISKFKTIKLERTACYGSCPIYQVEILSDGSVHYLGEGFVEQIGQHSWIIDAAAIEALNEAISKYEYFSMKAKEPTEVMTCSPSCITSILLEDGTHREIDNYHGADSFPKKLYKLENKIDEIIGIEKYVGKLGF